MSISHTAELRAFHATARAGSMSGAATQLGLTQPTVSAHIAQLEQQYGVELFFRRSGGVELTAFGSSLFETTLRLVDAEIEAVSLLLQARTLQRGQLRVSAVGPYNVLPIVREFRTQYPAVGISISMGDSQKIVEDIHDYRADLGVMVHSVTHSKILCLPYRKQPLVVFSHQAHPLARRKKLDIADLAEHNFVLREAGSTTRRVLEQVFAKAGFSIKSDLEIGSREAVREAVAQGLGLGIVSLAAYLPDPRLTQLAIQSDDLYTFAHLVYLKERKGSRLLASFVKVALARRDALALGQNLDFVSAVPAQENAPG